MLQVGLEIMAMLQNFVTTFNILCHSLATEKDIEKLSILIRLEDIKLVLKIDYLFSLSLCDLKGDKKSWFSTASPLLLLIIFNKH